MARDGWAALVTTAFKQSKNPMALCGGARRHVDANAPYLRLLGRARDEVIGRHVWDFVVGGPIFTPAQWQGAPGRHPFHRHAALGRAALASHRFNGQAELVRADGSRVAVQWAGTTEVATGQRLVLFVALSTSRWGGRFRRTVELDRGPRGPAPREAG